GRAAIERLTRQDIAVFFEEVLAAIPQLAADRARGGRVVDVHGGGGRWLVAMARRFPAIQLVGVEFEADSVARARAAVAEEGLADRIAIRESKATDPGKAGEYDLAYFQYALHQLPDAPKVLAAAWAALRPGGRILVLACHLDLAGHRRMDPAEEVVRAGLAERDPARRPGLQWNGRAGFFVALDGRRVLDRVGVRPGDHVTDLGRHRCRIELEVRDLHR